jgi:hypothetical protein
MKIKTKPSNYGKEVLISGGKKLKFSTAGVCEIESSEEAEEIIKKYAGLFWEEGIDQDTPKTVEEKLTEKSVEKLAKEISLKDERISSLKNSKEATEVDLKEWKNKYESVASEVTKLQKSLEEKQIENKIIVESLELEVGLWKTTTKELKQLCKDSGFNEEEYDSISKKEDLIEYILKKQ